MLVAGVKVIDMSLGASHGVALTSEGTIYAWGTHERAQITRPVPQLLQVLGPSFKANGKNKFQVASQLYRCLSKLNVWCHRYDILSFCRNNKRCFSNNSME